MLGVTVERALMSLEQITHQVGVHADGPTVYGWLETAWLHKLNHVSLSNFHALLLMLGEKAERALMLLERIIHQAGVHAA
jgi:hypothetical protein